MSWFEQITAKGAQVQSLEELETAEARDKLAQDVPQSFTLKELADATREPLNLTSSAKSRDLRTVRTQLLSVLACLRCGDHITPEPSIDYDAIKELALNIAKLIAPVVTQDQSEVSSQDLLQNSRVLIEQCQANSGLGIAALEALLKQTTTTVRLENEVLHTLLAYTNEEQSGGSHETEAIANRLLEQQFSIPGSSTKDEFLTETVLQAYLRPLFSQSKPSSITASGRKAEYRDNATSKGESMPDESAVTKPWKYTDMRSIPAVAWAVREANTQLIAQHWPLFIPVLLTLADDTATPVRRRGLLILADFLAKFPDKTLHNTGLAQVFEDAIFPMLSYLPSLTPEEESVELLVPAYSALLGLAKKQPAVGKDGIAGAPKNRFLDRMLREGVLGGYFHAKDHVRIVEVLCQQTVAILDEMGVHAVKHLKVRVPLHPRA
ncbi:hypothetical protein F5144DRAFT_489530 [Chaetomium tenue]|uniref:Uncharacterized protein n=1 Tax=Chaetomium tenue TaxID=1854479 RepID=A0ACB7P919_9PEZI|nr:hypothetical protein F5144DRAFT_489530 [Chaetomium globosum]